jgi:uncharacterized protein
VLLSFSVRNFKSFFEEQTLSLDPVFSDSAFNPLTLAAIYGSNASGKSNLLEALAWALPDSTSNRSLTTTAPDLRTPFKLTAEGAVQTSEASFEIRADGVEYNYGFEVDDEEFVREWLYSYPNKRGRKLFERTGAKVEIGASVKGRKEISAIASRIQPNRTVLSVLGDLTIPEWAPVLSWFSKVKVTTDAGFMLDPGGMILASAIERQPVLVELARIADIGIRDIEVKERHVPPGSAELGRAAQLKDEIDTFDKHLAAGKAINQSEGRRLEVLRALHERLIFGYIEREVIFFHGDSNYPLQLHEQSTGTLEFLQFASRILHTLGSGGLLAIDEVESSLHSRLVPRIIELFREKDSNPHGAQLIFTTHDTSLLGTSLGEPVLRRDEVWFVDKDSSGESHLVPLSDFKPRKDGENRERQYLGGAYGAVPAVFVDSFVEAVRGHVQGADDVASS